MKNTVTPKSTYEALEEVWQKAIAQAPEPNLYVMPSWLYKLYKKECSTKKP